MSGSMNKDCFELYLSGMSIPEVSEETGIALSTLRFRYKKAGILRNRADGVRLAAKKGKLGHPGHNRPMSEESKRKLSATKIFKGYFHAVGVSKKPSGYVEFTQGNNKGRSVHAVAMEKRLGRKLLPDECVHHIDGDKLNNQENNLCLVTTSGHARLHRHQELISNNIRERNENGRFA